MAEGDGLLNADQHFGHRRFSSQIFALQSLPRSTDLAAVGSGSPILGAGRDNFRDSGGAAVEALLTADSYRGYRSSQARLRHHFAGTGQLSDQSADTRSCGMRPRNCKATLGPRWQLALRREGGSSRITRTRLIGCPLGSSTGQSSRLRPGVGTFFAASHRNQRLPHGGELAPDAQGARRSRQRDDTRARRQIGNENETHAVRGSRSKNGRRPRMNP